MTTINIYYGGRGLIDDPSIYVMDKLTTVFDELNVNVKRYNLYEDKRGISVLPKTLKEADAVIITASVEWFGIGGLLQQFLDACWLYGDKDAIRRLYMMPVVLSTTYGEKEASQTLTKAWEILGGTPCDGICAYVSSSVDFETNNDYGMLIEKKAENFYRTFTKKMVTFPSSSNAVVETSQAVKPMTLTPQESEELSMYVSDDNYVKKQKEDIEELTQLFKNLMDDDTDEQAASSEQSQPNIANNAFSSNEAFNGNSLFNTDSTLNKNSNFKADSLFSKNSNFNNDNTLSKNSNFKADSLFNSTDTSTSDAGPELDTASLFSSILNKNGDDDKYIHAFRTHFNPIPDTAISFALNISDQNQILVLDMDNSKLNCYYGEKPDATATLKTNHIVLDRILSGEITLQEAFMTGSVTAKGNFNILKSFDRIFNF